MHKLTFFPLGNADCCRIDLYNGKKILFDYANCHDPGNEEDLRIDLAKALKEDLEKEERNYFDVVAFTHADDDHVHGAKDFFYLKHAAKYQGEDRIEIKELWVPAAFILESSNDLEEDARIIQAEARDRLKKGEGIYVFSRPERLNSWLEKNGLKLEDRKDLIIDAGRLIPGLSKSSDGVELFVHSPFAKRQDEDKELVDRNQSSLVVQASFMYEDEETNVILGADTTYDVWVDIVNITKYKNREKYLGWDVFKTPHHCSYLSLNNNKGENKTEPVEEVKWLFEQGDEKGIIVSTSKPIPEDYDTSHPPHPQAANYYKEVADNIKGEFRVTMEHPNKENPKLLTIKIDNFKATLEKEIISGAAYVTNTQAPRAGLYKGGR